MTILKNFGYLLVVLSVFGCSSGSTTSEIDKLDELQIRNGLPSFNDKIQNNDTLSIAYFGGSITQAEGWRVKSFDWLQDQFPDNTFVEVNAAIGGTNSQFGAFRLGKHVLVHEPDLVFVEFAVNDSRLTGPEVQRSMEGIVRQIWKNNIETSICFIYTLKEEGMLEKLFHGEQPTSVIAMEKVASHYGIPSISFAKEVCKQLKSNNLVMRGREKYLDNIPVFSKDGVHPHKETGHEIYASVFKRCMKQILEKGDGKPNDLQMNPLNPDNWEKTTMTDLDAAQLTGSWQRAENDEAVKKFKRLMPEIIVTENQGDKIAVKFTGSKVGFYDVMGPHAGRVVVSIDGEIKDTVSRFDKYCVRSRMNNYIIDGLEDSSHLATFEFLKAPFDKISILKQKHDTIINPEQYQEEYKWYVANILLDTSN